MKKLILPIACMLLIAASPAKAQVRVHIDIGLPVVPRLVVVQPGIQVVEGFNDEVFFHQGWYWCRRPDGWYRARHSRDRFVPIEHRRVPRSLRGTPEGRYRNWHHEGPSRAEGPRGHQPAPRPHAESPRERRERREDRRDERRDKGHDRGDRDDRGHRGH